MSNTGLLWTIVLAATAIEGASTLTAAPVVCDDPTYVIAPDSDLYKMHRIFNGSSSSRRVFSEIHYYDPADPHLTMGMGHWTYGNIATLFAKIRSDHNTRDDVVNTWLAQLTDDHWKQIEKESGEIGRDKNALGSAIDKLLCAMNPTSTCVNSVMKPWAAEVGENFNSSSHWLKAGWSAVGRLLPVAQIQTAHWVETVLEGGLRAAEDRNVLTGGGEASVISAKSSGLRVTMFGTGETNPQVGSGALARSWSLTTVPVDARPTGSPVREDAMLQDWIALVAWQYYTVQRNRVRSRMTQIWRAFYEPTWGPLPTPVTVATATGIPKHKGCYMRQEGFDFTFAISADPQDCATSLPFISQDGCSD